jgi:hypothetical protein
MFIRQYDTAAVAAPSKHIFASTKLWGIFLEQTQSLSDYGPAFAAIGVVTGVARPTNWVTLLSPEFAVHTLPLASTATPTGVLNVPSPVEGVTTVYVPETSAILDNAPTVLPSVDHTALAPSTATACGALTPPPI